MHITCSISISSSHGDSPQALLGMDSRHPKDTQGLGTGRSRHRHPTRPTSTAHRLLAILPLRMAKALSMQGRRQGQDSGRRRRSLPQRGRSPHLALRPQPTTCSTSLRHLGGRSWRQESHPAIPPHPRCPRQNQAQGQLLPSLGRGQEVCKGQSPGLRRPLGLKQKRRAYQGHLPCRRRCRLLICTSHRP